jgi:hypothetical protein
MDAATADELRVLGDAHRLALLEVLAQGPSSVRGAGLRAATRPINPAYHMHVLEDAGMVEFQGEEKIHNGRATIYAITRKGQRALALARRWERDRGE